MGDAGDGAGAGGGSEGMMQEEATSMSVTERSDAVVNFVGGLLTSYGWTVLFLAVVWYNCKDAVRRRWRKRQNERSLKHANRPERRAVLDRERARAVALKQTEAIEAARKQAEENSRQKLQSYRNSAVKDD
ncbi:unnamed protein product [Laminaria digitata]